MKIYLDSNNLEKRISLLKEQWSLENTKDFSDFKLKSNFKAKWRCSFNHEWEASISNRMAGRDCLQCRRSKDPNIQKAILLSKYGIDKEWLESNYINNLFSLEDLYRSFRIGHIVIRRALKLYSLSKDKTLIINNKNSKIVNTNRKRYGKEYPNMFISNSKPEFEIKEIIENLGYSVIHSDRDLLKGKEIDLFLKELNLGIEYNGLYWHDKSEFLKDKDSGTTNTKEIKKELLCLEKGIKLVYIWEDEWIQLSKEEKQNYILNIILNSRTC